MAEAPRATEAVTREIPSDTLATLAHEIPTSLLPALVTGILAASPAALAAIEGIANAMGIGARLAGDLRSRDPDKRRRLRLGGYTGTAALSSLTGVSGTALVAGLLRTGAWAARGVASPERHVQVAQRTQRSSLGQAYARGRLLEHAAAVAGPIIACLLLLGVGIRTAIVLSVVPGVLALAFALRGWRRVPSEVPPPATPITVSRLRDLVSGKLGWSFLGIAAFEFGNITVVLLILRATALFRPDHGLVGAARMAALGYALYRLAASAASGAAGRLVDRIGAAPPLAAGSAILLASYTGFAFVPDNIPGLAACFATAGVAVGLVEPSEQTLIALHAPPDERRSLFTLLAVVDGVGVVAASLIAGVLWTVFSPAAGLLWSAPALLLCVLALGRAHTR
ncbi:MAG TPA: MFS transporter [Thermoleophilaceae bacterium]